MQIAERVKLIQKRINAVVKPPCEFEKITLVAVSKGHSPEKIREAYALGLRDFAENRSQELTEKKALLQDLSDIKWHFTGRLQTNKLKHLVGIDFIHSVAEIEKWKSLNNIFTLVNKPTKFFIQCQIFKEDIGKQGFEWDDESSLQMILQESSSFFEPVGFMGMGPDPEKFPLSFSERVKLYQGFVGKAKTLWKKSGREGEPLISLGMSDDFEEGLLAGATHVRIGTLLFGDKDFY